MSKTINSTCLENLEFQMFVLDELAEIKIENGEDIIKLTIGVSDKPPSSSSIKLHSHLNDNIEKTRLVYPEGLPELRKAIVAYYQKKYNVELSFDSVFINAGTSALIRNLFQLLSTPDSEILLPRPYYSLYYVTAKLTHAKIRFYDIDIYSGRVDMQSFEENYSSSSTSVVIINNPGNPLGNIIPKSDVISIGSLVENNSFVIHDEIYSNMTFSDSYECPLGYLNDNLNGSHILTNSFSKAFRMYTKRVGFAIVPKELRQSLKILQQHTLLTLDPISQYAAIESLNDDDGVLELKRLYKERAEYAYNKLTGTKCNPIPVSGGFYIVVECSKYIEETGTTNSVALAKDILDEVGVAVVPGSDFGLVDCIRISFCNSRFEEGIDRLRNYFEDERN